MAPRLAQNHVERGSDTAYLRGKWAPSCSKSARHVAVNIIFGTYRRRPRALWALASRRLSARPGRALLSLTSDVSGAIDGVAAALGTALMPGGQSRRCASHLSCSLAANPPRSRWRKPPP